MNHQEPEKPSPSSPDISPYSKPQLPRARAMVPSAIVSDTLQTFPRESHYRSTKDLIEGETERIIEHGTRKFIVVGGGRPAAGSSQITREIMTEFTWEGSKLNQYAQSEGVTVRTWMEEWGQACIPFDRARELKLQSMPQEGVMISTAPPPEAAELFFGSIRRWIEDRREGTIDLLAINHTFNAGVVIRNRAIAKRRAIVLGEPRAEQYFRDFVQHKGMFTGLEYDAVYTSTDATPEVMEFTTEERVEMLKRKGVDRERYLEEVRQKRFERKEGVKMFPYGEGSASEENMAEINQNVDDTLTGLLELRESLPETLREELGLELPEELQRWIISKETLKRDPWVRSLAIIRFLNPFIFKNFDIPKKRATHFFNRIVHKRGVVIYRNVEENPLIVYYPKVYGLFAMEN